MHRRLFAFGSVAGPIQKKKRDGRVPAWTLRWNDSNISFVMALHSTAELDEGFH